MKFEDFHGCGCFDVKYVLGFFFYACCTHVFYPLSAKKFMISEKWEIRVHVFILGIWWFWWIGVVLIWTSSWVVVYACWWHVLYTIYSKFFTFLENYGWRVNLVLHGIWGFVQLGIIALKWPPSKVWWIVSHWFYTRCTMCSTDSQVFQKLDSMGQFSYIFWKLIIWMH